VLLRLALAELHAARRLTFWSWAPPSVGVLRCHPVAFAFGLGCPHAAPPRTAACSVRPGPVTVPLCCCVWVLPQAARPPPVPSGLGPLAGGGRGASPFGCCVWSVQYARRSPCRRYGSVCWCVEFGRPGVARRGWSTPLWCGGRAGWGVGLVPPPLLAFPFPSEPSSDAASGPWPSPRTDVLPLCWVSAGGSRGALFCRRLPFDAAAGCRPG
jgi:hypothetical protein